MELTTNKVLSKLPINFQYLDTKKQSNVPYKKKNISVDFYKSSSLEVKKLPKPISKIINHNQ